MLFLAFLFGRWAGERVGSGGVVEESATILAFVEWAVGYVPNLVSGILRFAVLAFYITATFSILDTYCSLSISAATQS